MAKEKETKAKNAKKGAKKTTKAPAKKPIKAVKAKKEEKSASTVYHTPSASVFLVAPTCWFSFFLFALRNETAVFLFPD